MTSRGGVVLAIAAFGAACATPEDPAARRTPACGGGMLAGDLVVTEVMANPAGDDDGSEWFEIYNASTADVDLAGVTLAIRKADGSGEHLHTMTGASVAAGDYLVVGDVLPELAPGWVDYGYGDELGSLVNSGGVIALSCGGTEVDSLTYPAAPGMDGGVTIVLDGSTVPDALANDDPANLCASTAAFADLAGMVGSPGAANEACDVVRPGTCKEAGVERATVAPAPGDLVISEVMPSPEEVGDAVGEWFEIYATTTFDLNGVAFGREAGALKPAIGSSACVSVAAGGYALFAREADPETNGGLLGVDGTFGFSLVGGSAERPGALVAGIGDEILDVVTWTASDSGASRALGVDQLDPTANDDDAAWSSCAVGYGAGGDRGTPRASNESCGGGDAPVPPTDATMCDERGTPRPIVRPSAGDLRITEVFANPAGNDTGAAVRAQEWIELEANAPFDLNGLELGENTTDEVEATVEHAACLSVAAGQRVVLGRSGDRAVNGGLDDVAAVVDLSLGNSGGRVFVVSEGVLLDAFEYGTPGDARSSQLDPDGQTICQNGSSSFGTSEGFGTPGAANPACDEL